MLHFLVALLLCLRSMVLGSCKYPLIDAASIGYNRIEEIFVIMSFPYDIFCHTEGSLWLKNNQHFTVLDKKCANLPYTFDFSYPHNIFLKARKQAGVSEPAQFLEINFVQISCIKIKGTKGKSKIFQLRNVIDITPHFRGENGLCHQWRWEQKHPNWHNEVNFVVPLPKRKLGKGEKSLRMREYPEGNFYDRRWYSKSCSCIR